VPLIPPEVHEVAAWGLGWGEVVGWGVRHVYGPVLGQLPAVGFRHAYDGVCASEPAVYGLLDGGVRNGGVELGGAFFQLPVAGDAEGFVGGVAVHVHHRGRAGGVCHVDHGVGVAGDVHHVVLFGELLEPPPSFGYPEP